MSSVLMIAFHYPPIAVSSGVHRTLKFSNYLPEYGWQPIVLTVNPRAYQRVSDHQLKDIGDDLQVVRAFGLDTSKHLAIGRRHLGFMALPDRWVSWWFGAVWSGLKLIRRNKPAVIWSTYPIATAHLIGLTLHKMTGVPWVADFRDSMTEDHYPAEKRRWKIYRWIEKKAVENASRVVFTTPGTVAMYSKRYPHIPAERWTVIPNGYDEENFKEVEGSIDSQQSQTAAAYLVHSGVLYPSERDPKPFFLAISELKREGQISSQSLKVVLRATSHDDYYRPLLQEMGIDDIVLLEPSVTYAEALKEMLQSDGLLLFQASNCNHQIPAKVYEYLRARRPIFALTDPVGDTAGVLKEANIDTVVPLDSKNKIKEGLVSFLGLIDAGEAPIASDDEIEKYSRQSKTKDLAEILNVVSL